MAVTEAMTLKDSSLWSPRVHSLWAKEAGGELSGVIIIFLKDESPETEFPRLSLWLKTDNKDERPRQHHSPSLCRFPTRSKNKDSLNIPINSIPRRELKQRNHLIREPAIGRGTNRCAYGRRQQTHEGGPQVVSNLLRSLNRLRI
uniref:Uncharacterized protein n=1 Tax=Bionectria ochroleuca TaxID=29856 RepID=A0A8H7KBD4_BIOOC